MLFYLVLLFTTLLLTDSQEPNKDRPIIGILTEETPTNSTQHEGEMMIVASYVKFLEAGGARVVPIWIYKEREYYEDIMSKINGVLFPGGSGRLDGDGYGLSGKFIFDIATQMNDNGDFFPLWGTCLGFELLNFLASNMTKVRKLCSATDLPTNIEFSLDSESSRMFQDLETNLKTSMQEKNVTIQDHIWCTSPKKYTSYGLDKYFKVLAVNNDSKNSTFVSIIEGIKYPFYGVAFHPEKVLFEWVFSDAHHNIPHHIDAVRTSQYFANFFVDEARKSGHHFLSKAAEDEVLIYNHNKNNPVFNGKIENSNITQIYYFK